MTRLIVFECHFHRSYCFLINTSAANFIKIYVKSSYKFIICLAGECCHFRYRNIGFTELFDSGMFDRMCVFMKTVSL